MSYVKSHGIESLVDKTARVRRSTATGSRTNPYVTGAAMLDAGFQTGISYVNLPPDARALIRRHTASRFVVEQYHTRSTGGIFSDGNLAMVPSILRLEFALRPRTTFQHPEFSMRITQFVNRQSPEFTQLIAGLSQEELQRLDDYARARESRCQLTMGAINRILVQEEELLLEEAASVDLADNEDSWKCTRQDVTTPSGIDLHVLRVPSWVIVSQQTLEQLRDRLQSVFHMQLEEI
jgi:hypothetical protein